MRLDTDSNAAVSGERSGDVVRCHEMTGASSAEELERATGPIKGLEYGRCRVGDAHLLVATAGAGSPLLLLHGFPQTHYCWRTTIPALAETHTVIAPDLRGYGGSSAPAGGPPHGMPPGMMPQGMPGGMPPGMMN